MVFPSSFRRPGSVAPASIPPARHATVTRTPSRRGRIRFVRCRMATTSSSQDGSGFSLLFGEFVAFLGALAASFGTTREGFDLGMLGAGFRQLFAGARANIADWVGVLRAALEELSGQRRDARHVPRDDDDLGTLLTSGWARPAVTTRSQRRRATLQASMQSLNFGGHIRLFLG